MSWRENNDDSVFSDEAISRWIIGLAFWKRL